MAVGKRVALAVNGVVSYLGNDNLTSTDVALSGSGTVQAATLYAPYGSARYTSGTMPGSYGFTGQRADGATGLDYYVARYYDPTAGQFASADTVLPGQGKDIGGLDRYAYVGDNPVTRTDPSGHCWLVCAVIAAVAVTVAVTVGNAIIQQATTGHVNWGQAITIGAGSGLLVGAAIALGPLAGAALGAIGEGTSVAAAVGETASVGLAGDAEVLAGAGSAIAAGARAAGSAVAAGARAAGSAFATGAKAAGSAIGVTTAKRFVSGFLAGAMPDIVNSLTGHGLNFGQTLADGLPSGVIAVVYPDDNVKALKAIFGWDLGVQLLTSPPPPPDLGVPQRYPAIHAH
jgi:RHS repeat-associated protein